MTSKYIRVNGTKLHYFDSEGNKPPFLFIHGLHGHAEYIISLAEYISPLFRVVVPDLPGHGKSEELASKFTMSGCAQILIQLMQTLNFHQYYVGGISMGGTISLEIITRAESRVLGTILLQPFYAGHYINKLNSMNKYLFLLLEAAKKPLFTKLVTKVFLDNDHLLRWLICEIARKPLTDNEINYRIRNVRACTGKTYIYTIDSILNYAPPNSGYTSHKKALILMAMDDQVLDAKKTIIGYQTLFPQHRLVKIHIDNHNPLKKPTPEEIQTKYPGLLRTISSYFKL